MKRRPTTCQALQQVLDRIPSYLILPPTLDAMGLVTSTPQWGTRGPRDKHSSKVLRPNQDWNPGLPKSNIPLALSQPHHDPITAPLWMQNRRHGATHFPPGCVTVDWIFASVPVFLRDTWTPAGPSGCPLLRTCRGEEDWDPASSEGPLLTDPARDPRAYNPLQVKSPLESWRRWPFSFQGGLRGCDREQWQSNNTLSHWTWDTISYRGTIMLQSVEKE